LLIEFLSPHIIAKEARKHILKHVGAPCVPFELTSEARLRQPLVNIFSAWEQSFSYIIIDAEDIIDEALLYFRANVLFRNFDVRGGADRTLIYLTMHIVQCLVKCERIEDKPSGMLLDTSIEYLTNFK
jgi:hypothetical protein